MADYTCPVCGFTGMDAPPFDHNICSCCGTEFGYHDVSKSYEQLRNMWLSRGAPWFFGTPPPHWSPWLQLGLAGIPVTEWLRATQPIPSGEQSSGSDLRKVPGREGNRQDYRISLSTSAVA